jgi:CspA family cold shock protein
MPTGKVRVFDPNRGYGFIEQDAGGPDIPISISVVREAGVLSLRPGQRVSFEIEREGGRSYAKSLKLLSQ